MTGVWVVYGWDSDPYVKAIFGDELEARRYADAKGYYLEVRFVEFGADFNEAVK